MKRLGFLSFLLVVFAVIAVFSAAPAFCADDQAAPPKVVVEPDKFDFGTVDEGEKPKAVFTIKNVGGSELIIFDVKPSCGCTVANLSTKNVPPGEEAVLEAVYNSRNASGTVYKYVNLNTNAPESQKLSLKISGTVNPKPGPEITLDVYNLNRLTVPKGSFVKRNVKITNSGQLDLTISELTTSTGVSAELADLKLEAGKTVKPALVLKPGETRVMALTVKPRSERGRFQEVVTIRSNAKRRPVMRFVAQGVVE